MALDEATIVRELWRQRIALLSYLEVIVRDEHLAEDVFQEVSVAVLRKRGEISDVKHLEAWLRQAARFHGIAAVRKLARRPIVFNDAVLDKLEQVWAQPATHEQSDRSDALRDCIDGLSPYARRLVELRYGEGVSGTDLAAKVGRKLNTIYVALSRIHRTLADCVDERLGRRTDTR
ncbi:MAG: sigma-70 family RNA polymerase sigma factor [Planctomycetes bacterium]|nr:sigma-70 family RNA polymerase sigma factor [Planctomycetota bacterium]